MECVATKRPRKWRKHRYLRKQLRERIRIKVRSVKNWKELILPEYLNARKTLTKGTMQADAFWENYAMAQEWQKKHNVTWWRSRCVALEYENEVLRDKVRSLAQHRSYPNTVETQKNDYHEENDDGDAQEETCARFNSNNENLEFNMTEDMLNFFETSERHRRELQEERKSKEMDKEKREKEISIVGGAEIIGAKKQEADLLYGDAGSKILSMEIALQTAMEKHEATVNPQYWPNIPLKP